MTLYLTFQILPDSERPFKWQDFYDKPNKDLYDVLRNLLLCKNENRTNKSKLNFEVKTNSSKKIGILIEKNN